MWSSAARARCSCAELPCAGFARWNAACCPSGFWSTPLEQLYRADGGRAEAGAQVVLPGLSARIVRLTEQGRPRTIRFLFERALDSPHYVFLTWHGDRFVPVRWDLPAPSRDSAAPSLRQILARALRDNVLSQATLGWDELAIREPRR